MPPIDPLQLLRALSPLLSPEGGIKSVDEVSRLSSLMKKFSKKLVSRCVYINVLRASPVERIDEFLKKGGWETIHMWLHESKKSSNYPFLIGLLQLYKLLPMTVDRLKENNSAKLIKGLTKSDNEDVKTLATQVVDSWVKLVKGDGSSATETVVKPEKDAKDIKKKKRKDKEEKKETKKEDKKEVKKEKDKNGGKEPTKEGAPKKLLEKKDSKERDRLAKEPEKERRPGKPNAVKPIKVSKLNNVVVVKSDDLEDVKLPDYIRAPEPSDKVAKPERKSTVKRYQARFRSIGIEEPTPLPGRAGTVAKKKVVPPLIISKLPLKRFGDSIKDALPPSKKLKSPTLPLPKSVVAETLPAKTAATESEPKATTAAAAIVVPHASKHEVERREIKLIAPRPKPVHVIQESAGFMDALVAPPISLVRKKKKAVVPGKPTTPTSPSISAPKLQFYKDTLDSQDDQASSEPKDGGDDAMDEGTSTAEPMDDEDGERSNKRSLSPVPKDEDSSASATISETTSQTSSSTVTQPGKRTKARKSVSWAAEASLKQIRYFELDETERVNVNNIKNFGDMKTLERQNERQVVENARRKMGDEMEERTVWLPLIPIDLPPSLNVPGCNSLEREIQRAREAVVLQEIFFSKESLPDTPHEPDPEVVEPEEPKIIPLEDENNPGAVLDYSMQDPPAPVTKLPPELSKLMMALESAKQPVIGLNVLHKAYEMVNDMNLQQMNNDGGQMHDYNQGMEMPGMANPAMMGIPPPGYDPMSGGFHHQNNDFGGPPPMDYGGFPPPPMGMDGPPREYFDGGHGMMNQHMGPPMMGGPRRPPMRNDQGRPMMRHPGPYMDGGGRGGRGRGNMMGPNSRGGGPNYRGDGPNFRGDGYRGAGPNRGRGRGQRGGFSDRGDGGFRGRGPARVCPFYMAGNCKYENNCANIHPAKNGPHS